MPPDRDPADFPGNPNPPAKAPQPAAASASAPASTSSAGTGALPPESQPAPDATPLAKGAGSSYVVSEQEGGAHAIFNMTDDGPQKVGMTLWGKDDLSKILQLSGASYDKEHGVYENVPEQTAKLLKDGPKTLSADLEERLNAGLADFHRASLGLELGPNGSLSAEDFRQRTQPDLVQLQFDRHQGAAWHGLGDAIHNFIAHPDDSVEGFLKRSVEGAAKALPSLADVMNHSMGGAIVGGGLAAFAGPEAVPLGMSLGASAGTFLAFYNQKLGSRLAALADRGLSTSDIHKQAPLEAVKSAVSAGIFMYGVDAMAAPFKASFLTALAAGSPAAKAAAKEMSSWAYNYAVNAGIKMPAIGAVEQLTSDLMDNLGNLAQKRPDLMKSPLDFANNAVEAAAGMGQLGLVAGIPGAAFEAVTGAMSRHAELKLAAATDARFAGVERLEPTPQMTAPPAGTFEPEAPPSQGESGTPSGAKTPGSSSQTASSGRPSETPPIQPQTPPAPAAEHSFSDSIKEHPAFVKAQERAKLEGVNPDDATGAVRAYVDAARESHDFGKIALAKYLGGDLGKSVPLTPDEKIQISAQVQELVMRMGNLRDLAEFAYDPEGKAAWKDWEANGAQGEPPRVVRDPFTDQETARLTAQADAEAAKKFDETLADKNAKPEDVVKTAANAARLGEKVQETTVKARAAEVKSNLDALQQRIGEILSVRDRMKKNGLSTRALDRQVNELGDQAVSTQKELELLKSRDPAELEVSKKAKLEVKPATLQNITDIAFKEGGKQSQERAREMLKIAQDNGLSAPDVKKLVGNRAPGAMGDTAYKNFIEGFERENAEKPGEMVRTPGFKEGVEKLVERKKARAEVAVVLNEKQLENEQHIRKLNGLPAFSKMTTEQLKSYADILRDYDKNDTALAPKRVEALKGTMLEGVKTEGEVREKVAQLTGRPVEDFQNVRVPLKARAIPDPQLREWFPALRPFVDLAGEMSEKGERLAETVRGRNEELAAAAIRERHALQSVGTRAADFLAPQQREVMAYLEAKEPADVVAAAEKLTPAEMKWANFLKQWFGTAEDYLVKKEGMESRFSGAYAPHVNRGWPEILRDLKEKGLWSSLKEFAPQAQGKNADFVDAQGNVLGFNKFFKQSIFRSGALEPSKNVVEAANQYISDFYRKAALDQVAPVLDTLARAMKAPPEETGLAPKENEAMTSSLQDFVKAYVNNKKGINNSAGAVGELLAPALRMSQKLAALHYIAGNYALQAVKGAVAIPISEYMVLGTDLFKAKALKYTEQGQKILEKYESFTGKSPWEEVGRPGADARDFASALTYGGFGLAHKAAMEDILLGSMTKDEFAKGEISDARLNEIRQHAGRWMDLSRSDSIMGSSAPGKAFTQYKGWAIPPTLTLAEDARALARAVSGKGKLSDVQVHEAMRLSALAAAAGLTGAVVTKDMEDGSYRGQAIHYLRRAVGSVWRGLDPTFFLSAAGPGYVVKLAADLRLLLTLERDKNDELKGVKALKRDLTPRLVKDLEKATSEE